MKLRYALNLTFSLLLSFSVGITSLGAGTTSNPVSVSPVGLSSFGEALTSKPVSVSPVGTSTFNEAVSSKPVSVSPVGIGTFNETLAGKPVSVSPVGIGIFNEALTSKPVSVALQPANTGDPDLVGLWHMDGDWGDSSGNGNHGSPVGGVTFSTDKKVGTYSGSFDGTSGYVGFNQTFIFHQATDATLVFWIKHEVSTEDRSIFWTRGDSTDSNRFNIGVSNGNFYFDYRTPSGTLHALFGTAIPIDTWTHIAVTRSANTYTLYMNGAYVAQATDSSPNLPTSTTWMMSGRSSHMYKGYLDEVALYKRALSATEIQGQFNSQYVAPPTVNPVQSPTGSQTIMLSGTKPANTSIKVNSTEIVPNDALTTWQGNYTLQPGVNSLSVTAVDSSLRQSQAVLMSVIYDNTPPVIESSSPANNSNTALLVSNVSINLVDTYSAVNLTGSTANATVKNSAGQLIPGSWTTSGTKTIIFTPNNPFPPDTYTVTIYPLDALGNAGMQQIVFTNHDTSPPVTTISLSGTLGSDGWYSTPVTVTLTADDGANGSGVAKTEYSFDNSTWTQYTSSLVLNKDGVTTVYYRSTDNAGNVETAKSQTVKINQSGLVGLWHMENNWLDSSVVGNNGTSYNGSTFSSDAKVGSYAGSFDGVNGYVAIGNLYGEFTTNAFSIEAWVKVNSTANGARRVIAGGIGQYADYGIGLINNQFMVYTGNKAGTLYYNQSGVTPNLGQWYHVAGTFDGTTLKIYVNGQLQNTLAATWVQANGGADFWIGGEYCCSSSRYSGLLDEVSLYNRVLSDAEILANYQAAYEAPPSVDPVASPTASQTITLTGTKPANTSIDINGTEAVPLDSLTTWQTSYYLQPGANALNVVAINAGGDHSDPITVTVIFDNTPPRVSTSTPQNNAVFNTAISSVSLTLMDDYSGIDLNSTVNGASVKDSSGQGISGTWAVSGSDTVIFTPSSPLVDGTYTVTVYPTDTLGNGSTAQITFTYDTTAPSAHVAGGIFCRCGDDVLSLCEIGNRRAPGRGGGIRDGAYGGCIGCYKDRGRIRALASGYDLGGQVCGRDKAGYRRSGWSSGVVGKCYLGR